MRKFFFNHTAPTHIYTLSLHDALPIYVVLLNEPGHFGLKKMVEAARRKRKPDGVCGARRSEEHTSELQSQSNLVCRPQLVKKNTIPRYSRRCGKLTKSLNACKSGQLSK